MTHVQGSHEPIGPAKREIAEPRGAEARAAGPGAAETLAAGGDRLDAGTRGHIRGSSLLLVGRSLSMFVNFIVQVLIVRYLDKEEYGAFAYALSLATFGETIVTLGFDRAIGRFLPIYEERGQAGRLVGTIALVLGTILGVGVCLILLVFGLSGWIQGHLANDALASSLLLILIFMAPLNALDRVFTNMLAVFASARSIFFRKFLLGPGLRLAVVALLVLGQQAVPFLAAGYVVSGLLGIGLYVLLLAPILRRKRILPPPAGLAIELPIREIVAYTVPLLTADLVFLLMNVLDAVLLAYFHSTTEVAAFRVIQPLAGMNQLITQSFILFYTPAAARLFARGDRRGAGDLYWQTATWLAVFTVPMFLLTFSLAGPVTTALYGEAYAGSAIYLAVVAVGRYVDAALGFNGVTVRIFGNIWTVIAANLLTAALNLILNFLLIPPYGAFGAAIALSATLLLFNLFNQIALARVTGISFFEARYVPAYGLIALIAIALLAIQLLFDPPIVVGLALAAIASVIVLVACRDILRVGDTFPEIKRLPLSRWLIR